MKTERTFIALIVCCLVVTATGSLFAQPAKNCDDDIYPLFDGNRWTYDILEKGAKAGTLEMIVAGHTSMEFTQKDLRPDVRVYSSDYWLRKYDLFHLEIRDSRGTELKRSMVSLSNGLYFYVEGRLIPFLQIYVYHVGQTFNRYVVVELAKEDRKYSFKLVGPENQVESYESGKGLVYYRKGATEYKLTSADIKGCSAR